MPRIKEYETSVSAAADIPGRRARESDFGGPGMFRLGQAVQGAGRDIGSAGLMIKERESQEEVTNAHVAAAEINAEWTAKLTELGNTAQPGDDGWADKFLEEFDAHIGAQEANYTTANGRRTFRQAAGQLKGHFTKQAMAVRGELAGIHAKQQYQSTLDSHRNVLVNDPTQFDRLLASALGSLNDPDGSYSRIPSAQREPLLRLTKEQMAMSAVQGVINLSPQLALKQLSDGRWDQFLDADKRVILERHANVALNAEEVEARRVEALEIKARKEEEIATQEEIVQAMANGTLTTKMILNSKLAPTGGGSKEHFLNVLRTRNKEVVEAPIKTVPSVMLDLFSRVHAPTDDPRKITDEAELNNAYIKKQLSFEDFTRLRKEVADARTPEGEKLGKRRNDFMSGISPQIDKSNPMMGKIDASGKQQVYEFGFYVDQQVEAYRKAGKNPYDLFDPSKPDFLGKPQVLSGFQKTMQQSMAEYSNRLRSKPTALMAEDRARKPGETPEQYLARMGSK
ncbi:hypothetical protein [Nitrosovibrio sp. Nv4]|uniref:hypothetical protein n=1 Tax=Nitrosovibrio sp. Nv4 TaxID=1945880 RepID=UPI000BD78BA6|nr:hypothetical protein [Nitrosovibrio sp. Nv4]SOD41312.1 hypothetical protein SAMN06298226_1607 [Nitrosovibrio sp. Nv4]